MTSYWEARKASLESRLLDWLEKFNPSPRPARAPDNLADLTTSDVVLLCKSDPESPYVIVLPSSSDRGDVSFGELGHRVTFTDGGSSFVGHVPGVVGSGSKEEVVHVEAPWLVALVKDAQVAGNRTVLLNPSQAMDIGSLPIVALTPVSTGSGSLPNDAGGHGRNHTPWFSKHNPYHDAEGKFTTAGRAVTIGAMPSSMKGSAGHLVALTRLDGGLTFNPKRKNFARKGFAVAVTNKAEEKYPIEPSEGEDWVDEGVQIVKRYMKRHADLLAQPNAHLGTWIDGGKVYLDVSVVVQSAEEASAISAKTDQIAFFDLGTFSEWRRDDSGSYSVSKAAHSPVVYTRAADLQTDEEIHSLVEFLLSQTISKHARHDQKTHGKWATGRPLDEGHWDRSGDTPKWVQSHEARLHEARSSWKGSPSDMSIHMADEIEGAPEPASGSGKKMRSYARALLDEFNTRAILNPTALYRGTTSGGDGYTPSSRFSSWSESYDVASRFGEVNEIPPGAVKALPMFSWGPYDEEKEWVVDWSTVVAKHEGGGHDQKTHGNWAGGGGSHDLKHPKWTREGELLRSEKDPVTLLSEKRQKDAQRVKRLQDLGALPGEKPTEFTSPGDGIRELTWGAGKLPGEALVASSFGWSKQPITVNTGSVPVDAEVLARLTDQVHETLGELSPEFRVRNIEVTDDASPGGGQYSGGTTLKISPWAIPMSAEERTALADEMYGESHPDFVDSLNDTSEEWQVESLAKAVRHESGHYIENQLRLRTSGRSSESPSRNAATGNEWWREWSNKVAPAWEAQAEPFFRQEFASGSHQSRTRFRQDPLFYTAATHGWSGDHQFEGSLRGVDRPATRNAELFAEYVRFELSGMPFPNGDMIGAHIRKAAAMPGVTVVDGDGDGYVFDGTDKERVA